MSDNFKMIAKTFYGFEEILSEELLKLGAQKIIKGNRNVSFYVIKVLCINLTLV